MKNLVLYNLRQITGTTVDPNLHKTLRFCVVHDWKDGARRSDASQLLAHYSHGTALSRTKYKIILIKRTNYIFLCMGTNASFPTYHDSCDLLF